MFVTRFAGRMKLIDSLDGLRAKIKMIEALLDIEAAVTMLSKSGGDCAKAEVDQHYEKLHCKLKPVERGTETYEHLEKYVRNGKVPPKGVWCGKFPNMKIKEVRSVTTGEMVM